MPALSGARLPEVDLTIVDPKRLRSLLDLQVQSPQVRRAIDARLQALANPLDSRRRRPNRT